MRIFNTHVRILSLAKRNKNSFWVEDERHFEGDYSCHHYEVTKISWKNYKKKMQRKDKELYLFW